METLPRIMQVESDIRGLSACPLNAEYVCHLLDGVFGLGSGTACVRCVAVATVLNLVIVVDLEHLLETGTNLLEDLLRRRILAGSASPQPNSVEALSHIDHDTHDLIVSLVLESLADGGQLSMKPQFVNVDGFLVLESIRPLPAVFVLDVFPFGSHASLEKMVIGFDGEIGCGGDVVLSQD
jgi:hypothetical protein